MENSRLPPSFPPQTSTLHRKSLIETEKRQKVLITKFREIASFQ